MEDTQLAALRKNKMVEAYRKLTMRGDMLTIQELDDYCRQFNVNQLGLQSHSPLQHEDNILSHLIRLNKHDLVEHFLKNYEVDVAVHDHHAFKVASVEMHNQSIMELLLKYGADINAEAALPLRYVTVNRHLQTLMFLVKHGANPQQAPAGELNAIQLAKHYKFNLGWSFLQWHNA